jgi:hypothetical protein
VTLAPLTQCAAVKTYLLLIRTPPHKKSRSSSSANSILLLVRRLASLTSVVLHEGKPRIVWPVRFVQAALGGVFRVRDRTGLLKQLDGLHRTAHFGEEERLEAAVGAPHVTVGLVLQDLAEEMRDSG